MKFLRILKNIFVWLVAILAVAMMAFTVVSVATFDRTGPEASSATARLSCFPTR